MKIRQFYPINLSTHFHNDSPLVTNPFSTQPKSYYSLIYNSDSLKLIWYQSQVPKDLSSCFETLRNKFEALKPSVEDQSSKVFIFVRVWVLDKFRSVLTRFVGSRSHLSHAFEVKLC